MNKYFPIKNTLWDPYDPNIKVVKLTDFVRIFPNKMTINLQLNRLSFDFNDYPTIEDTYNINYDEFKATSSVDNKYIYPPINSEEIAVVTLHSFADFLETIWSKEYIYN